MSKQYESLTKLIPEMEKDIFGEWNLEKEGECTEENTSIMPYVSFTPTAYTFFSEMGRIVEQHPEFNIYNYKEYLVQRGYISDGKGPFPIEKLQTVPSEKLNEEDIFAMCFAVQRSDRFCEGIMLKFFKDGTILAWLKRLAELDEQETESL